MIKVGDVYPVWWCCGYDNTINLAKVISIEKYTGIYKESFTHVLRLSATNTIRGWMEMSVKLESTNESQ